MASTTIIATYIDTDRVYRDFQGLENLWIEWDDNSANPRVSTADEEEYGGVQYSVEHRTGVFKHAGGHRTTIHVFTCPSSVEVDNEGRKKHSTVQRGPDASAIRIGAFLKSHMTGAFRTTPTTFGMIRRRPS